MNGVFSELQAPLVVHLLGTTLLAILLWSLHARLRRHEFNRWWASAWTLTALFQAGYSTRFHPELGVPQPLAWLATTIVGFLVIPTLVFGTVSFRSPGRVTRPAIAAGLGGTVAAALALFSISVQWVGDPVTQLAILNAPRTLALAGALVFSALVFLRRAATTGSGAAMLTGVCCFAYAGIQAIYTTSMGMYLFGVDSGALGSTMVRIMATLMPLNIVTTFGICLGQVLLVVDEHQRAERALVESLRHERQIAAENTALQSEIERRQQIEEALRSTVAEQLRTERDLRQSEEKFAVAFRSSPCGMVISTLPEGRFIDANATFETLSGFTCADLVGRTSLELGLWNDPADRPLIMEELERTGRLRSREIAFRTRSGAVNTLEVSAEIVTVGGRRCLLWASIDVTGSREAEARHRAILRALPDWLFLTTHHGVFVQFQARDPRHLVMPPSEFIGRNIVEVLPPDLASRILNCFREALASDQPATLDYSLGVGDEERFYEVRAVRSDGDHVLSLVRDVTDRKRAELRARELQDELMHTGRVLALGTLTGSLAHEINQPLSAIATNAHVAIRALDAATPDLVEIRAALRDIVRDNQRIDEVLRRLRLLLRKERRDYAAVDLNTIVNDVLGLVHSDFIQRRIRIDMQLGSLLPPVMGDRIQLQQVVLNILMNAAEAVSAQTPDDRHVRVSTQLENGQVIVSVADRGAGISDAAFDQLFTPFYTTKADGMGLGLSIARTIMDAHGGRIHVTRNADRGLTCWFALDPMVVEAPEGVLDGAAL
jgi:PAS domain S-box-containing protein